MKIPILIAAVLGAGALFLADLASAAPPFGAITAPAAAAQHSPSPAAA
jgi:hypothetical protein